MRQKKVTTTLLNLVTKQLRDSDLLQRGRGRGGHNSALSRQLAALKTGEWREKPPPRLERLHQRQELPGWDPLSASPTGNVAFQCCWAWQSLDRYFCYFKTVPEVGGDHGQEQVRVRAGFWGWRYLLAALLGCGAAGRPEFPSVSWLGGRPRASPALPGNGRVPVTGVTRQPMSTQYWASPEGLATIKLCCLLVEILKRSQIL